MKPISQPPESRGLLHQTTSLAEFDLTRILPDQSLADLIENYWLITWDRPGKPNYIQQNIPHPSQNLVIDPQGQTGLFGIITKRFSYTITRSGALFGVKFHPGALRAFSDRAMSTLTDRHLPVSTIFDFDDAEIINLFTASDPQNFAHVLNEQLLAHQPIRSKKITLARKLVTAIDRNPEIKTVADLADYAHITPRSLQRLFGDFVGVSPAWVIQRYRVIDAVDAINKGEEVDLTTLAQTLGFYDSAHFSRSFKALIGTSPQAYRRTIRSP